MFFGPSILTEADLLSLELQGFIVSFLKVLINLNLRVGSQKRSSILNLYYVLSKYHNIFCIIQWMFWVSSILTYIKSSRNQKTYSV